MLVVWWPKASDQKQTEAEGRQIRLRYEVQAPNGDKLHDGEESLNKLPKDLLCLVLVDPTEVSLFAVVPPKLSGNQLKEALPFLVEPYLLNEPEENHVSLWPNLPKHAGGAKLAAVLSKSRARQIVDLCNQHRLKLSALSCETLLEQTSNDAVAWFSGNHFILVDGTDPPLLTPTGQASVLKVMLQRRLQLVDMPTIELNKTDLVDLNRLLGNELNSNKIQACARVSIEPLTRLLNKNLIGLNELRKMGIQPIANQAGLRKLLAPALALLTVAVLGLNALAFKAERANANIQAQIEHNYSQALPNTPMVADPLMLLEREKRNLNSGLNTNNSEGLSALLHEVGKAMELAPFNSMVNFTWRENTLNVSFSANITDEQQNSALEKLKMRNLEAKWLMAAQSSAPVLQVKRGSPQ